MATLTVNASTDFRGQPAPAGIDRLVFGDPDTAPVVVTFDYGQFGPGELSNPLTVEGGQAADHVRVTPASGNGPVVFSIAGWSFANWSAHDRISLFGAEGEDVLNGSAHNDILHGYGKNDVLSGAFGDDTLEGGAGNDNLFGNEGRDRLRGEQGADFLDGGAGDDVMSGGHHNDRYKVDSSGDRVIELGGQGKDEVIASADFILPDHVEDLRLAEGATHGTGNSLANWITGSKQGDLLEGLGGDDRLYGAPGNDTLKGGLGNDDLSDSFGDNVFYGEDGNDLIHVGDGDNVVFGGAGDDTIWIGHGVATGGSGNDVYIFADLSQVSVVEEDGAGGGMDTVEAQGIVDAGALPGIETIVLTDDGIAIGDARNNLLISRAAEVTLLGGAGNDTLQAAVSSSVVGAGNRLDGGAGADELRGSDLSDSYINPVFTGPEADTIVEAPGGGKDIVFSDASISLLGVANVEALELTGDAAINGTGNELENLIWGNAKANRLDGRGGADNLRGDSGNDTLQGGTGEDRLFGQKGNDVVIGGLHNDELTGGAGADVFRFTAADGVDRITDFETGADRFDLAGRTFTSRTESGSTTRLEYDGGSIVVDGVAGLSLAEWNALIVPAGGGSRHPAAAGDEPAGIAPAQLMGIAGNDILTAAADYA